MKIAVTGGTGFLGRYILRQLAPRHTLRAWYRANSDRSGLEDVAPSLTWVLGELGDSRAAADLVARCDAVVHSALHWPAGERIASDDLAMLECNLLGTLQLVQAARRAGVGRFIYISSCAVHDRILDDRPLDEAHPLWPCSHYGAHKAAVEAFVHSYGFGEGYDICALRPTGIYGLAHPPKNSKWFDLIYAVRRGHDVRVQQGGKEVHAADVARAVELLLTAEEIAGQAYNCYDRYVSEYDVATLTQRLTGSPSRIIGQPKRPQHEINTDKLRALGMSFGGLPLLEQTVRQMLDLPE